MGDQEWVSEAEALDDDYTEGSSHFISGNEEEGGEFVIFPNRAREEVTSAFLDLMRSRSVEREDKRTQEEVIADMKARYVRAKAAKVGETIECACCGKKVIKTAYQMAFCSNGKNRKNQLLGNNNCKDRYWNLTSSKRRAVAIKHIESRNKES
jgi:hypothetical protein